MALRLNIFTEPPTLDPRLSIDITSFNILLQLFEGLTRMNDDQIATLAGAQRYELSDDGLTYTFHLREALWSNGERVTVDDYVDTWREILHPLYPSPFAFQLFIIKNGKKAKRGEVPIEEVGIAKIDEKTLSVTLEHPAPYFLEMLASSSFYPTHRPSVKANEQWAAECGPLFVSNGPFQLTHWIHDGEIEMHQNPYYWDREAVHLDRIDLCMINDATTEFYMFEQGELDWAGSPLSHLPAEIAYELDREGRLNLVQSTGVEFLQLNTEIPPLGNQNIRRALGLAINRTDLMRHVYLIDQGVAKSLVPPLKHFGAPLVCYEDHQSKSAQDLFAKGLKEEGLTLETFPSLVLSYNTCRQHQKVMQAIQQQWNHLLGIKVSLEVSDWKAYLSSIANQNYTICRHGWIGTFHDPINYLLLFKTTDEDSINHTGWHSPTYKKLLDQSDFERDKDKRTALLREAETLLMEEMPVIPLRHVNFAYIKSPRVKDIYVSPLGILDLKQAKVER
ncbi:MAG: Oligopeptide-binding protein OppA [Chlamydiales bacterium]|nr:Oligopeptide-binding protein OppA [Chlamydiales bacterium]MCH9623434.1 Oligopeptide-binding protein OppA [Chlamydiales bacterium]